MWTWESSHQPIDERRESWYPLRLSAAMDNDLPRLVGFPPLRLSHGFIHSILTKSDLPVTARRTDFSPVTATRGVESRLNKPRSKMSKRGEHWGEPTRSMTRSSSVWEITCRAIDMLSCMGISNLTISYVGINP